MNDALVPAQASPLSPPSLRPRCRRSNEPARFFLTRHGLDLDGRTESVGMRRRVAALAGSAIAPLMNVGLAVAGAIAAGLWSRPKAMRQIQAGRVTARCAGHRRMPPEERKTRPTLVIEATDIFERAGRRIVTALAARPALGKRRGVWTDCAMAACAVGSQPSPPHLALGKARLLVDMTGAALVANARQIVTADQLEGIALAMAQASQLAQAGRVGIAARCATALQAGVAVGLMAALDTALGAEPVARKARVGRAVFGIAMAMTADAVDVAVVSGGRPAQQRAQVLEVSAAQPAMTLATVVQAADAMAGVQRKAGLRAVVKGGRLPGRQSVAGGAGHGLAARASAAVGQDEAPAVRTLVAVARPAVGVRGPAARRWVAGKAADILVRAVKWPVGVATMVERPRFAKAPLFRMTGAAGPRAKAAAVHVLVTGRAVGKRRKWLAKDRRLAVTTTGARHRFMHRAVDAKASVAVVIELAVGSSQPKTLARRWRGRASPRRRAALRSCAMALHTVGVARPYRPVRTAVTARAGWRCR